MTGEGEGALNKVQISSYSVVPPPLFFGLARPILTVVVALDGADQAEELDYPAEVVLHLLHKHTRKKLEDGQIQRQTGLQWAIQYISIYTQYYRCGGLESEMIGTYNRPPMASILTFRLLMGSHFDRSFWDLNPTS